MLVTARALPGPVAAVLAAPSSERMRARRREHRHYRRPASNSNPVIFGDPRTGPGHCFLPPSPPGRDKARVRYQQSTFYYYTVRTRYTLVKQLKQSDGGIFTIALAAVAKVSETHHDDENACINPRTRCRLKVYFGREQRGISDPHLPKTMDTR